MLGVVTVIGVRIIFSSLRIECLREYFLVRGLSSSLIVVRLWVGGISYLCSKKHGLKEVNMFRLCVLVLTLFSVVFFIISNWLGLYFFFEAALFPILMLILGWGYQPERLQAAGYMLIYTVGASLPLLIRLIIMFYERGTLSFYSKSGFGLVRSPVEQLLFFVLILAFMVKFPIFMVHAWLPKAHVEAPVAGSIILAGVMLKYGGYGLINVI